MNNFEIVAGKGVEDICVTRIPKLTERHIPSRHSGTPLTRVIFEEVAAPFRVVRGWLTILDRQIRRDSVIIVHECIVIAVLVGEYVAAFNQHTLNEGIGGKSLIDRKSTRLKSSNKF